VLIADIAVDQLTAEIKVGFAFIIPQFTAPGPGNHQRVDVALYRPRMENISAIQLANVIVAYRYIVLYCQLHTLPSDVIVVGSIIGRPTEKGIEPVARKGCDTVSQRHLTTGPVWSCTAFL